ncbi:hypothetical protein [Roseofilum casamattae]|uniref:Bacterial Pleckstrin homology domain-containing protein n=1 Tax=Roseofilum casamattae BLCC-M143 TaxID=3022442 RepID=A0ABT7BYP9_9CYAN|nr:hypothetical protein [Roseofilum casamattae]MDJ1184334.1 hypothetical protein [Roseofilum casamattae BLCC-M143]
MSVIYKHVQLGTTTLAVIIPIILIIFLSLFRLSLPVAAAISILIAIIAVIFATLTVTVTETQVQCQFSFGLIRKAFPISEISRVAIAKNPWYYGWGIRLTPKGWMFNVSGLDAVELELNSGSYFRIGTDEPEALHAAISRSLELRRDP